MDEPSATPTDPGFIERRLDAIRQRISASGGDVDAVEIVAVTKGLDVESARAARAAGLLQLGENYAAQLLEKAEALSAQPGAPVRWHLIGGIQRRSLAKLAPYVALYQSVDRDSEIEALARHRPAAAVLIEVETTGLPGREGVAPDEVGRLVGVAQEAGLNVRGLMTVAAPGDEQAARTTFRTVRRLVDSLGLATASMGMSDDFEIAVQEGSTMVRLGRALLGPRATEKAVSQ